MLKQALITATIWLTSLIAFAQKDVTVYVLDHRSKPLQGATVQLHGTTKSTDEHGTAIFSGQQAKTAELTVRYLGFAPYVAQVDLQQRSDITATLQPDNRMTGEVMVMATRAAENSATTFKNLSKEDLSRLNLGQDIPFLLDQTPSVVVGSDAGAGIGYTNMTIRGSNNQRINVTLNGIPLNDAESMGSFFVNLPDFASSVQSIQIQRGIGTSTNGAGAFGASLNIQTDALETTPYAEPNN